MADSDTTGQVPDTQANPTAQDAGQEEPFDKDRAMATIQKLRGFEKLSKEQAKELEAVKAQLKAHEDAKLSDQEKLANRAKELEAQAATEKQGREAAEARHRATVVEYELKLAASGKLTDPEDAVRFIPAASVELDDSGRPKNAGKLIDDLLTSKPYLAVKQQRPSYGTPQPGNAIPPPAKGTDKQPAERPMVRL